MIQETYKNQIKCTKKQQTYGNERQLERICNI